MTSTSEPLGGVSNPISSRTYTITSQDKYDMSDLLLISKTYTEYKLKAQAQKDEILGRLSALYQNQCLRMKKDEDMPIWIWKISRVYNEYFQGILESERIVINELIMKRKFNTQLDAKLRTWTAVDPYSIRIDDTTNNNNNNNHNSNNNNNNNNNKNSTNDNTCHNTPKIKLEPVTVKNIPKVQSTKQKVRRVRPRRKYFKNNYNNIHMHYQHVCQVCGKRFKWASRLNSHQITHSNEKPYQCNVCKKRFKRKQSIKKHICSKKKFVIKKPSRGLPLLVCESKIKGENECVGNNIIQKEVVLSKQKPNDINR